MYFSQSKQDNIKYQKVTMQAVLSILKGGGMPVGIRVSPKGITDELKFHISAIPGAGP